MARYDLIKDLYEFKKVNKNGKWGLIDEKDRFIVPIACDDLKIDWDNKIIFFVKDKKEGFMNLNGEIILENKEDVRLRGKMGNTILIAANNKGEKVGLYDAYGNQILEPIYENFCILSNDLLVAGKNGKYGILKLFPEVTNILDFKYTFIQRYDNVIIVNNDNKKYGVYDLNCNLLIPEKYDSYEIRNSIYLNHENGFDIFNKNGKYIKTINGYNCFEEIKNKRLIIEKDGKYGVIDKNGNVKIKPIYDVLKESESGKYYFANIKGKYALITEKEQITPFEYEYIYEIDVNNKCLFLTQKEYKRGCYRNGLLNDKGRVILPTVYHSIYTDYIKSGYLIVLNDSEKSGIVDLNGNIVLDTIYDKIYGIRGNKVTAWLNGVEGYVLIE